MDLRRRFGVLKAALVKWLGLLMSPSLRVERMARRHSQSRLQIVWLYSRRSHHLGKRRVGTGTDCRTGLRGDREYGSMAFAAGGAANSQKAISERQRSASALRATS